MQKILTEESFSAPVWLKIVCYILSLVLLLTGINLLMIENKEWEILLAVSLIFLVAVSMFIYTRPKLIISSTGIRFVGNLKQHSFSWADITKVDMARIGKYKTPQATIYYSDTTLNLDRGFYLKEKFDRILSLLEMEIDPGLFTVQYREIRNQPGSWSL